MRLIETKTLKLVEVWAELAPKYAILSHRWDDEEVSLAEYQVPTASTKSKAGWQKIIACARQALIDGHAHLWVDTCCIDKTSSAELSEAINSMYRWYQKSEVCYVYLNDVPHKGAFVSDGKPDMAVPFERSQWHIRGWTLQELLAPATVRFYSKEWKRLDDDAKIDIHQHVSRATGIGVDILKGDTPVHTTSIARRMSWASRRQTTRTEDVAYCLLGIFDVNMPMLYGEGPKAFMRLQAEIMKTSRDQTLFVWNHFNDDPIHTGLLAQHPRNFKDSADFEDKSQLLEFDGSDYNAEREGISLSLFLSQDNQEAALNNSTVAHNRPVASSQLRTAILRCAERDSADRFVALQLVKHGTHYMRHRSIKLERSRLVGVQQAVFIRHQAPPQPASKLKQEYVRILFESNCPNAYAFAMPSKTKAPPPLFRTEKARTDAEPGLARNAELGDRVAKGYGHRLASLDESEIPQRLLIKSKREVFNPMDYEFAFDVPLDDLKWVLPLLPKSTIVYMRVVLGNDQGARGVCIGTDVNAQLGFDSGHSSQGFGALGDNICRTPIAFEGQYSFFFHHRPVDRPSGGDEVAEVKLSLRHHQQSDTELQDTDTWEHQPGQDKCPCEAGKQQKGQK